MAAAALQVDRLRDWMIRRRVQRDLAELGDSRWEDWTSSDAGLHSEAPGDFPGPRSAWVR